MENKKKLLSQILLIVGFVIIAMGSATYDKVNSSYQDFQNSDAGYYTKSVAEGLNERDSGRKYIGKADSESDCYKKAQAAGCTGQYIYYEHSNDCYCK